MTLRWHILWMTALLFTLLQGCALPPLHGRSESRALSPADAAGTTIGRALAPRTQAHPGESGILPLADALASFERRDGLEIRHTREPGSSLSRRAWMGLLSVLPIEWLLL